MWRRPIVFNPKLRMLLVFVLLLVVSSIHCGAESFLGADDGEVWSHSDGASYSTVEGNNFERLLLKSTLENGPNDLNKKDGAGFIRTYLDGVMVKFRSRVASLYRKISCSGGQCDLWVNAGGQNYNQDPLEYPSASKLEIVDSSRVHNCHIQSQVSTFVTFQESTKTLVIVGYSLLPVISMYELQGDGLCKFLGNYDSPISPTLLITRYGEQHFLIIKSSVASRSSSETLDICLVQNGSIELMQPLVIKHSRQIFSFEVSGQTFVCLVTSGDLNGDECVLYKFMHVSFEVLNKFGVTLGSSVDYFSHGKDTFVVSANYSSMEYSGVTVWRFDGTRLQLHQVLSDCHVEQVKAFTINGYNFIAVICRGEESFLYWWSGSQFLLWQTLFAPNAISWTSLALNNEESILVLHSNTKKSDRLEVYQLSDGFYQHSLEIAATNDKEFNFKQGIGTRGIMSTRGYLIMNINVVDGENYFVSYSLNVGLGTPPTDYYQSENEKCIKDIEEALQLSDLRIKKLIESVSQLQKRIVDSKEKTKKKLSYDGGCDYMETKLDGVRKQLVRGLHYAEELKDDFRIKQNDSVVIKTLDISGSLNAKTVVLENGIINGVDLESFRRSVLTKSTDQTFDGSIVMSGGLTAYNLDVQSINGINVKDNLALIDRNIVFTRPQHFAGINATNIVIEKAVNDVLVRDVVMRSRGQVIGGQKTFKKLVALGNVHLKKGKINGVNLNTFSNEVLTFTGNQVVHSPVVFKSGVTVKGNLDCSTINAVDIGKLAKEVVTTDKPQIIYGETVFTSDLIVNSATLAGKLNGIDLIHLLTRNTEQNISGSVEIRGNVKVRGDIEVLKTVNEIDVSEELVTKCGNHTITGSKIFENAITVDEFIQYEVETNYHHYGDLTVNSLDVAEINGIEVNRLLGSFVRKSEPQVLTGRLNCEHVSFMDISVGGSVNNDSFEDAYLTTGTEQTIRVPLIIENDRVLFKDDVIVGEGFKLNGVDVSELDKTVMKPTGDQIIRGRKVFRNVSAMRDLKVVSGREHFSYLAYALVGEDKKLDRIEVLGNLYVESDLEAMLINGGSIGPVMDKIRLAQSLIGETLFGNVTVLGDLNVNGRINDLDPDNFFKNLIRLTLEQEIVGDVTFAKPVTFSGPLFTKNVNGRDLERAVGSLVLFDIESGVVNAPVVFQNGLKIGGDLDVDYLNGKNFSHFASTMLLNGRRQLFPGPTFVGGNIFVGDLKAFGEMNGRSLSNLVLINEDVVLNRSVQFKAPVTFSALAIDGNVSVDPRDLHRHRYRAIRAQRGVQINGGSFNGLRMGPRTFHPSSEHGVSHSISLATFNRDVTVGRLRITNSRINGVDLREIRRKALTKDTKQTISGRKTFVGTSQSDSKAGVIFRSTLEVDGNLTADSIEGMGIEGMDSELKSIKGMWNPERLFPGRTHAGNVEFRGGLYVDNNHNGSDKTFHSSIQVDGDLEVNILEVNEVNGINIRELINERVTLTTDQTIDGKLEFLDDVKVINIECGKGSKIGSQNDRTISSEEIPELSLENTSYFEDSLKLKMTSAADKKTKSSTESQIHRSDCSQSLVEISNQLSGILNDFQLLDRLPQAHAIGHYGGENIDENYLFLILATLTISPATCNNVQIMRCDKVRLASCQVHESLLEVPAGFVSDLRSFQVADGEVHVFLMTTRRSLSSNMFCAGRQRFEGVYLIVRSNEEKRESDYQIFIPGIKELKNVIVFGAIGKKLNLVLSSGQSGSYVYDIGNGTYKILLTSPDFFLGTSLTRIHNHYYPIFFFQQSHFGNIVGKAFDLSDMKIVYETKVEVDFSSIQDSVAFTRHNHSYLVVGTENYIKVLKFDGINLSRIQEINRFASVLQVLNYKDRIFLTALTRYNEIAIYRWTDLFNFVAETVLSVPFQLHDARLFSRGGLVYLVATSEKMSNNPNKSSFLYQGMVTGSRTLDDIDVRNC